MQKLFAFCLMFAVNQSIQSAAFRTIPNHFIKVTPQTPGFNHLKFGYLRSLILGAAHYSPPSPKDHFPPSFSKVDALIEQGIGYSRISETISYQDYRIIQDRLEKCLVDPKRVCIASKDNLPNWQYLGQLYVLLEHTQNPDHKLLYLDPGLLSQNSELPQPVDRQILESVVAHAAAKIVYSKYDDIPFRNDAFAVFNSPNPLRWANIEFKKIMAPDFSHRLDITNATDSRSWKGLIRGLESCYEGKLNEIAKKGCIEHIWE